MIDVHTHTDAYGFTVQDLLQYMKTDRIDQCVVQAILRPAYSTGILEPTYGEYEVACHIAGAIPIKQWMKAEDNFSPRIEETTSLIREHRPRGVFICNPNNPTGKYLSRQEVEMVLDATGDSLLIQYRTLMEFGLCLDRRLQIEDPYFGLTEQCLDDKPPQYTASTGHENAFLGHVYS